MAERICDRHKERFDPETGECPLCLVESETGPPPAPPAAATESVIPLPRRASPDEEGDDGSEETGDDGTEDEPQQGDGLDEGGTTRVTGAEAFFAELEKIKQRGHFAILFFGFRTAGKTW